MLPDMGSREFLSGFDEFMWYPAEVDVSIRLGWFYHPLQRFTLKSLNHLMKIYYTSAGNNSLFLLNIPPNKNGLFANSDVKRLKEMGKWLKGVHPCSTGLVVDALARPEWVVEVEVTAVIPDKA